MKNRFDHLLQFKVRLKDVKPPVWRRIQVPCTYTFWDLHVAIQDAMGWLDYHLHALEVRERTMGALLEIGIPPEDEFEGEPVVLPGWEIPAARHLTLADREVDYLYDFGDGWKHAVVLEKVGPRDSSLHYPVCVGGRRACPPENCGGPWGYKELLEALADPEHDEHETLVAWMGGSFDPEEFEAASVRFDDPEKRWERAFLEGE
jgi:hypothetical protein